MTHEERMEQFVRERVATATWMLNDIRTVDPSAHAALVRQAAADAGLRCLDADDADLIADHVERTWPPIAPDLVAALRGEHPSEVPHDA